MIICFTYIKYQKAFAFFWTLNERFFVLLPALNFLSRSHLIRERRSSLKQNLSP